MTLAHGQVGDRLDDASRCPNRRCGRRRRPNLYQLELAVAGESSYSARVGLRQLTWHGRDVFLNGRRLLLHGATIQEDVPGPRRRAHAGRSGRDRRRAEGDRRERRPRPAPARPGAARTPGRGRACWCGRGSARSKAPATGTRRRRGCSPKPSSRPARPCTAASAAPVDIRLEPGRRGGRQRARPGRGQLRARLRPLAACARPRPAWSRSTSGAATPRRTPGVTLLGSRRGRRDRLHGLV